MVQTILQVLHLIASEQYAKRSLEINCCLTLFILFGLLTIPLSYAADKTTQASSNNFTLNKRMPYPLRPLFLKEIELGGGYNSENSFKFGEYSGLQNQDGFVIGNIQLIHRAAHDSSSTKYWKINGRNLGLESRFMRGEYGQQGKSKVFIAFNQTPHYRWDDAKTPFIPDGSLLNLPSDWIAGGSTAAMSNLDASLQPVSIATKRNKLQAGASWRFNPQWSANIQFFHEKKHGFDISSGIFGTISGIGFSSILPRTVNYATNDVTAELNYSNLKSHLALRYNFSLFDNNNNSLTWQNPFSLTPSAFPNQGRVGLAPDNQAHQVSLNFGHRFDRTTRLAGVFSYSRLLQNQDFLPLTINPNLTVTNLPPRKNANAQVNNWHGNLTLTARPFRKANLLARYVYTDRDNQTPSSIYSILRNDSENQNASPDSAFNRINLPYGYRRHKAQFNIGYRMFAMSRIEAGYDFERFERDYAEVASTNEHTARIKLTANPFRFLNAHVEYAHSLRRGSTYRDNKLFIDSHTQNFLATLPVERRFSNNPSLRKFQYSDRNRNRITGSITIVPTDNLTAGITGYYLHDNYHAAFGLSRQDRFSGTVDMNYALNNFMVFHAFYSQEYFLSRQNGFASLGALSVLPPLDPANFWWLDNKENVYTFGAGYNWIIIDNKLDIELNYLFSSAVTDIDTRKNTLSTIPLPNIKTNIHSINFHGNYRLKEKLRLRFSYRYESFHTIDFARDNVAPSTLPQVISLGSSSPDYNAHVAGVSMVVNF